MEIRCVAVPVYCYFWRRTNGLYNINHHGRLVSFLFPYFDFYFPLSSQMSDLEKKLLSEANKDAKIVACRFPLPNLKPIRVIGDGIDTVWLYTLKK